MSIDLAALKTEITTDPETLGYAAPLAAGQTGDVAALLNASNAAIRTDRDLVPAHEIFEAIVQSEWAALDAQEKSRIALVLSMSEVNVKGTNTRAAFTEAFANGTGTRTALVALLTKDGTRAEQLFGSGARVTHTDVARASRL